MFLVLLAAGAFYAIVIERHWFARRHFDVPCLPEGSESLQILHLSDLHFRSGQGIKKKFLAKLAETEPDLVVVTGDMLGDKFAVEPVIEALRPIKPKLGAVFVLGSNDYYSPVFKNPLRYLTRSHKTRVIEPGDANPWTDLVEGLTAIGWTYLSNESTEIGGIEIVGMDDAHIGRARPEAATARVDERFRLAVAHSPDSVEDLASKEYDLILSGHTHGGQVRVPVYGALVTNCDIPREQVRWLHRLGRSWLHVSAGMGTSMFAPYRFACRPEATELTLLPRKL